MNVFVITDISLLNSWRVIDTITSDGAHKSFSLASLDNLQFLSGGGSREDTIRFLDPTTEIVELIFAFFFFSFKRSDDLIAVNNYGFTFLRSFFP